MPTNGILSIPLKGTCSIELEVGGDDNHRQVKFKARLPWMSPADPAMEPRMQKLFYDTFAGYRDIPITNSAVQIGLNKL